MIEFRIFFFISLKKNFNFILLNFTRVVWTIFLSFSLWLVLGTKADLLSWLSTVSKTWSVTIYSGSSELSIIDCLGGY
jgi:hypothetical protein